MSGFPRPRPTRLPARLATLAAVLLLTSTAALAGAHPVAFKKHQLDPAFRSEGVAVADLNGDGKLDIAAGNVYFAGPDWKLTPMLDKPREFPRKGYSDAFLCFADDLDGDGWRDLICVGFPGNVTTWLQNPGKAGGPWKRHRAIDRTGNESPEWTDADGDGKRELVFVSPKGFAFARPGPDPTKPWAITPIAAAKEPKPGHGLGLGDLNADGRTDVLCPGGWWEGPAQKGKTPWAFHRAKLGGRCAQMCVADFDGDGDNDVLSSDAHAFGIWWCEHKPDGWTMHEIDKSISQTHALHLADLNGDGLVDFVTGKRFWAHNGHDPGSDQPVVLCWYEMSRKDGQPAWTKHVIDSESGVGLHFVIADVNGDGLLDIVTSNKKGVHYFEHLRPPAK